MLAPPPHVFPLHTDPSVLPQSRQKPVLRHSLAPETLLVEAGLRLLPNLVCRERDVPLVAHNSNGDFIYLVAGRLPVFHAFSVSPTPAGRQFLASLRLASLCSRDAVPPGVIGKPVPFGHFTHVSVQLR